MVIRRELSWQYNGVAPWTDIQTWCKTHLGAEHGKWWYNKTETLYFDSAETKTFFLLVWA